MNFQKTHENPINPIFESLVSPYQVPITLWLFNIAMENSPFIDDFPSYKPPFMVGIFHGYVSHNQMVNPIEPRNSLENPCPIPSLFKGRRRRCL